MGGFLGGLAGGVADRAMMDRSSTRSKKPTAAGGFKGSPIQKLGSAIKGKLTKKKAGATVPSYKKGGKIKKTGPAKLHKGEEVLTKRQQKRAGKKR